MLVASYRHQHVSGLLQTSTTMTFQSSLSSVLLMSSLLGDSFVVTKLFRLYVYFVHCLSLLLVPQIFPLSICFSIPSALFICSVESFRCTLNRSGEKKNAALSHSPTDRFVHTAVITNNSYCSILFPVQVSDDSN